MNNQDYWEKRSAQQMWGYMDEAETVSKELMDLYIESSNEVQRAARKIFQTYKSKYGLTHEEAERLLKMISDPTDLRAVLRKLEEDPKNTELIKQIEGQAYGSRLARLSSVYSQIDDILMLLYAEQQKRTKVLLEELARQAYYDSIFNLHQYSGYGFDFKTLSRKQIERVLNSRWYGHNYSEKIWENREKLAKQVKKELIKNLLTGRPLRDASKSIEERFSVGYGNARRLIRTESCYTCNQLQLLSMKEHGVERYIYVAILDLRTSEMCRSLDKKDFAIDDAVPGKNLPPMHPWCRSTIIAYVPKELLAKMKQSAIDPVTGQRIKVPGDMTHAEWYEKFVKGKEDLIKSKPSGNRDIDKAQFEKYKEIFPDEIPNTLEKFRDLKYNNPKEWNRLKAEKQDKLNSMEFNEMQGLLQKLGKKEARAWYIAKDKKIPSLIDKSQSLEAQARQACALRNQNRTNTRDLMKDQEKRKELDIKEPNKTFEELLNYKMDKKHLNREEAMKDIIGTATKTRSSVNKKYGLEE